MILIIGIYTCTIQIRLIMVNFILFKLRKNSPKKKVVESPLSSCDVKKYYISIHIFIIYIHSLHK